VVNGCFKITPGLFWAVGESPVLKELGLAKSNPIHLSPPPL
jgi:hypothetical protein